MRLDKWLKVSRLIKRRTVAQDVIEIRFGAKTLRAEVLSVQETVKKDDAAAMYREL